MPLSLTKSGFLHLVRWVAAVLVVMNHLRAFIFKDFKDIHSTNPLIKAFYFITSLGHFAVIIFFVLSGYLISGSVIHQMRNNKFLLKNYSIKRFARLYAVLPVALLVTSLFDIIGNNIDNSGIYNHRIYFAVLNFSVMSRENILHFISSLLMLQNIIAKPLGSDSPLWSLSYEFWYYLLFPLTCIILFYLIQRKFRFIHFIAAVVAFALIAALTYGDMLLYYTVWLVGLIPVFIKLKNNILKLIIPILLLTYLVFAKKLITDPWLFDLIFAVIFSFWITVFRDSKVENRFYKMNEQMAGFSYSLYLLHFPFILFTLTLLYNFAGFEMKMMPSLTSFTLFVLVLLSSMLFSAFVAYFTERKTLAFKNFLTKLIAV